MGNRVTKTEHAGAKNGGGYWGKRVDAKEQSNSARRVADKALVAGEDQCAGDDSALIGVLTDGELQLLADLDAWARVQPDAARCIRRLAARVAELEGAVLSQDEVDVLLDALKRGTVPVDW